LWVTKQRLRDISKHLNMKSIITVNLKINTYVCFAGTNKLKINTIYWNFKNLKNLTIGKWGTNLKVKERKRWNQNEDESKRTKVKTNLNLRRTNLRTKLKVEIREWIETNESSELNSNLGFVVETRLKKRSDSQARRRS
jgi:hypothetical protein